MSMSAVCELPRLTLLRSGEHTPNKGRLEERRGRGAALHQGRVSVRTDNDRGEMITGLSVRHLEQTPHSLFSSLTGSMDIKKRIKTGPV